MKCVICDETKWENVDKYRIKPHNMMMCKNCGFVTYPERYKDKAAVLEYYRHDYRGAPPQAGNLFTGQVKLKYHEAFLADTLKKWMTEEKKNPVVFDTGAAIGLFLAWLKNLRNENGERAFPEGDFKGSELTLMYRRVAFHEFGIFLSEDFDESVKYDLISSYKVAEHMFDIDQELLRYRDALKPDGLLYISVPIWHERMYNFGSSGWDIEYYYHPDHVNVWGRQHFEHLLVKSGFEIVKQDHLMYDSTYLCKVNLDPMALPSLPTPLKIEECLDRVYKADQACTKRDYQGAVKYWPNFPQARRAVYEYQRAALHKLGYKHIFETQIKPWIELDPGYHEPLSFAADIAMRYNRYEEALEYCAQALKSKPNGEQLLFRMGDAYRAMAAQEKDQEKALNYYKSARKVMQLLKSTSVASFQTATNWIYNDHAMIPMPGE